MLFGVHSLAIPPAIVPTNNNVVKEMKRVLVDTDEEQQQVSIRDPQEKLNRFDIVSHVEFCIGTIRYTIRLFLHIFFYRTL